MKKFSAFFIALLVLLALVLLAAYEFVLPKEYPVFLECYGSGVMTVDSEGASGQDSKYVLNVKRGETLTISINPLRTEEEYYNLEKLTVNGEDVTKDVNMLQYKRIVDGKLDIIAYFEKGKRKDGETSYEKLSFEKPNIAVTADNPYLGSYGAYDFSSPSVVYDEKSGYYYAFGSDNQVCRSADLINWTDRTTYFKSPDGVSDNRIMLFSQFPSVLKWAEEHGYTSDEAYSSANNNRVPKSPDIIKIGSAYYLYFSLSKTADANESAIFCVRTTDLGYAVENKDWQDVGVVISTCGYNSGENKKKPERYCYDESYATAPNVFYDKDGGLFMAYGSYYGREEIYGGIYLVELNSKTGLLKDGGSINPKGDIISTLHGDKRYKTGALIARPGAFSLQKADEGSIISECELFYDDAADYYYLFVTYGDAEGSYNIRYARSKNAEGPYLDYNGKSLSEFSNSKGENQYTKGTYFIGGYNFFMSSGGGVSYTDTGKASTGCPSFLVTKDGKTVMAIQSRAYYKANGKIVSGEKASKETDISGAFKPCLEIRQFAYTDDLWLCAQPEPFAYEDTMLSVEKSDMYGHWDMLVFDNQENKSDYKDTERSISRPVTILEGAVISKADIEKGKKLSSSQLNKTGSFSYEITVDKVKYTVYPTVAWDSELSEPAYVLSGIGEDGSVIWGKKGFSSYMGVYTDAFYHVLSLSDDLTQTMYKAELRKIGKNPSQEKIDEMTVELIEKLLSEK